MGEKQLVFPNRTAWSAGLGYGDYKISKRGTWDVKVQYFNFGDNIALQSSRWEKYHMMRQTVIMILLPWWSTCFSYRGYRGWLATAHYALQETM